MKELIQWKRAYERIDPLKIDDYFERGEDVGRALVELLENDSTAIFHVDPTRLWPMGDPSHPVLYPLLLAVNYHNGHSEGDYKVVVQNIPEKKGPWVLFRPPGSSEDTFYLQDMVFPRLFQPKFKENVANPLKIKDFYLYKGDSLRIFAEFKERGLKFFDEPMSEEHYERLLDLC